MRKATVGTRLAISVLWICALVGQNQADFRQSYPLERSGTLSLRNVCGDVHIQSWDRDEVLIEAFKTGPTGESLDEAQIQVNARSGRLDIETEYPSHYRNFSCSDQGSRRWGDQIQAASVEYTLTVPRDVNIDEVKVVNSDVDVVEIDGDVRISTVNGEVLASRLNGSVQLSTVNGRLQAESLRGRVDLSTVNGDLEVDMAEMEEARSVSLSTVNGGIVLSIPRGRGADVKASTVHGKIRNDFGLEVKKGRYVGSNLRARVGDGGPDVDLSTVNGSISITNRRTVLR